MSRYSWSARMLGVLLITVSALVLGVEPALAHKLKVYAGASGAVIEGYAYFPGGGRARSVKVEVLGPDGEVLGQTTTDEGGAFAFEPAFKCDHAFVVDAGDGHRATYTVEADELSDDLPSLDSGAGGHLAGPQDVPAHPGGKGRGEGGSATELDAAALSRQIRGLREQIEGYEEKTRFHDVLGGIGYIFGMAGIAFYFLARRSTDAGRRK